MFKIFSTLINRAIGKKLWNNTCEIVSLTVSTKSALQSSGNVTCQGSSSSELSQMSYSWASAASLVSSSLWRFLYKTSQTGRWSPWGWHIWRMMAESFSVWPLLKHHLLPCQQYDPAGSIQNLPIASLQDQDHSLLSLIPWFSPCQVIVLWHHSGANSGRCTFGFRLMSTHPRKWKICLYCWFAQPILAWNLSWFCLKERNIFFMTFLDVGILRPWSAQPFWMSLLFSSFYIGNKSTTNSLARTTSAETFFCKHEWIVSCFCLNFASTSFCSELFCKLMPSFFCKWYIGDVVTCSGLNLAEQHFTTESSLDLTRTCFQTSDFLPVSFFQPLEFDMMDLIC